MEVALQDAFKFHKRLFVKCNQIHLVHGDAGVVECPANGMRGKSFIVLLSREGLLAGCSNGHAIQQQTGCGVVIKATDTQNIQLGGA